MPARDPPPDMPDTPTIPRDLPQNPRRWNPHDVNRYIEANMGEYGINEDDLDCIRDNKISGKTFLTLTQDELRADPYNVSWEAAAVIEELINSLKQTQSPGKLPLFPCITMSFADRRCRTCRASETLVQIHCETQKYVVLLALQY